MAGHTQQLVALRWLGCGVRLVMFPKMPLQSHGCVRVFHRSKQFNKNSQAWMETPAGSSTEALEGKEFGAY